MDFLQNSYFLIGAIAVVVLLVILLVLLRARSRRTAKTPAPAYQTIARGMAPSPELPTPSPASSPPGQATARNQPATTASTLDMSPTTSASEESDALTSWLSTPAPGEPDFSTPSSPQPPAPGSRVQTVAGGAVASSAEQAFSRPFAVMPPPMPAGDPVYAAVAAIAAGTGPLDAAEMRRLDLYRSDRVLKAVESVRADVADAVHGGPAKRERLRAIAEYIEFAAEQTPAVSAAEAPVTPPSAPPVEPALDSTPVSPGEPEPQPEPTAAPAPSQPPPAEPTVQAPEPVAAAPEEPEQVEVPVIVEAPLVVVAVEPAPQTHAEAAATPKERPVLEAVRPFHEVLPAGPTQKATQATTGADLAALPEEQWDDALQRASLAELRGVLATSANEALKMKVVDRLEHDGSSEALTLLDKCLQDSNPNIQLHALNAAERMLQARK